MPADASKIMDSAPYSAARWGFLVQPLDGGEPVFSQSPGLLTAMGSTTKLFTVGTWLDTVGLEDTQTTPVYSVGDGVVLVASGDLTMGARDAASGTLGYGIPPQPDANGLPGAKPAPGDPLTGLDDLARQVVDSGRTEIAGDVVIDDRLFELWDTSGGPISPIVINDNLLGIVATPGEPDEPATLELHPETAAFTIENQTTTVAAGQDSSISIDPAQTDTEGDAIGTTLVVSGQIAADADPQFNVYDVPDPARYARTLFIEALTRAGATVAADPTGTNSTEGLPAFGSYPQSDGLGAIVSPPTGETATLIWKISHNYGANLAVCLLAVTAGSTECTDGLAAVHDRLGDLDLTNNEVWILNGAGEEFSSTTPQAVVTWLTWLRGLEWGDQLSAMLPILGEDGSLSLFQTDGPATGQVQAKTGTWAGVDPSTGMLLMPAAALAGFMQDADGNEYVFGLYMANATFGNPAKAIFTSAGNIADVAAAFQQDLG